MKQISFFEVKKQLLSLECFVWSPLGTGPFRFNLIGTDYYVVVYAATNKRSLELEWRHEDDGLIPFEDVLESVPVHIQEQLLFCLNLFV